jgi:uncharacterized protein (DUF488 family)
MDGNPIYSIGHGTRKIEDFLNVLKDHGIEYLIDVRSIPFSKFNPQFSQGSLKYSLEATGIKYVFMGDTIGGRPTDPTCYTNGKVDYEKLKTTDLFQQGIERVKRAYAKKIPIALMCSESKPSECHRSKLIGKVLFADGISLNHIDETGNIKSQANVINELNKGMPDNILFPD